MRIFAKIILDDKTVRSITEEEQGIFSEQLFYDMLLKIAEKLDIGTPIILRKHINHFLEFNNATFTKHDFAENISFDRLMIEEVTVVTP